MITDHHHLAIGQYALVWTFTGHAHTFTWPQFLPCRVNCAKQIPQPPIQLHFTNANRYVHSPAIISLVFTTNRAKLVLSQLAVQLLFKMDSRQSQR